MDHLWASGHSVAAVSVVLLAWLCIAMRAQRVTQRPCSCLVLVTGCDSGFGLGVAKALSSKGYRVIVTCMTEEGLQRLQGIVAGGIRCDVTKEGDVLALSKLVNDYLEQHKECVFWCLVNNAGVAPGGMIDWLPMELYRFVMDVNFFAPIRLVKEFLPYLKRTRGSRIINLSSVAGVTGSALLGPYCGSKHALEGVGKAMRDELKPWGIEVCHINPGFMKFVY